MAKADRGRRSPSVTKGRKQPASKGAGRNAKAGDGLRFPLPAGREPMPTSENDDVDRLLAARRDWFLSSLVHHAVHKNNPRARAGLSGLVRELIEAGVDLDAPLRDWMVFVLRELERKDAIPHLGPRKAVDVTREATEAMQLARELAKLGARPGRMPAKLLGTAADNLCMSYSKARGLYYRHPDCLVIACMDIDRLCSGSSSNK